MKSRLYLIAALTLGWFVLVNYDRLARLRIGGLIARCGFQVRHYDDPRSDLFDALEWDDRRFIGIDGAGSWPPGVSGHALSLVTRFGVCYLTGPTYEHNGDEACLAYERDYEYALNYNEMLYGWAVTW